MSNIFEREEKLFSAAEENQIEEVKSILNGIAKIDVNWRNSNKVTIYQSF